MSATVTAELFQAESVSDGMLARLHAAELDRSNALSLAETLYDLALRGSGPLLHLDFAGVRAVTEHAAFRLVVLARRLEERGERLILHNVRPHISDRLHACRITDYLEIRKAIAPA